METATSNTSWKRYAGIREEHPDCEKYGVFFAFSNESYATGCRKLTERGLLPYGAEPVSIGAGGFCATRELAKTFLNFYKEADKRVAAECLPQDVYDYECRKLGRDSKAYKVAVRIFGKERAAAEIKRKK